MSYLDDMDRLLSEHERRLGVTPMRAVEFVRVGSFQVKVTVHEPAPKCWQVFDLKAGFTPGTQRAIREWYEPILNRSRTPEPPAPPQLAPELNVTAEPEQTAPDPPKPVQRAHTSMAFMQALRRRFPVPHRG